MYTVIIFLGFYNLLFAPIPFVVLETFQMEGGGAQAQFC